MRVFVLDSSNSPLTPCHPARARMLLARGRAEVAARTPFTIRLKEARPDAVVVPVAMGIDDGAKEVPSIRAKKEAIARVVRDFSARCIVERIVLEDAQIDTQKLKSPTIEGVQYQQGFTKDYCNLREAVLYRDRHTCQHCGERNKRLEVHHRHPRSEGGTNQPGNLITLCVDCHGE